MSKVHNHIALLGDSTIDNRNYVPKNHTVMDYVWQETTQSSASVTMFARDGAVMKSIYGQLAEAAKTPSNNPLTHMLISIGGNDLLGVKHGVYSSKSADVGEALVFLRQVAGIFRDEYEHMARAAMEFCARHDIELALATVYRGNSYNDEAQHMNETAVVVFNEVIREVAASLGLALVDMFRLFDDEDDFANPIEPSSQGGWKIGRAVDAWVRFTSQRSEKDDERLLEVHTPVFGGPIDLPEGVDFPRIQFAAIHGGAAMWGDTGGWWGGEGEHNPSATELLLTDAVGGDPLIEDALYEDVISEDPEVVRALIEKQRHPHDDDSWKNGEGNN
jgi:lysophospholipase L1-like esterase